MCARDIEFTYLYDFSIECWNCSDSVIYIFSFYYRLWKNPSRVAIVKINMVVIAFRNKNSQNEIQPNWYQMSHVSTSFKIYLDILSKFYITFTIFYYNTISLKCTFFSALVKGLYQTESYSLHVMQLIRI